MKSPPRECRSVPDAEYAEMRTRCPVNGLPQHTCRTARAYFKRQLGKGVRGLRIYRCPHCRACHVSRTPTDLN